MTTILKQSTEIKVRIGPFVDASDAVTPETGITLGAADQAELLKANGAATVDISGATWAAITGAGGWYDLTLTTSHTNTVGEMEVVIQDSSVCLPVFAKFQVVEEAVYDDLYAGSATGYPTAAEVRTEIDSNSTQLAAIVADTNELQTDWIDDGRLDLILDIIAADVVNIDGAAMRGTDSAYTGTPPTVSQIWETALTEAYRSTGATGTAAQLLYEILQNITEFAISGTTKTTKKLDGTTTAKTYTLDSSTAPTSITEAT